MQGGGTAVTSLLCVFWEPAHDEQVNIDPLAFGSVFKPLPYNVSFAKQKMLRYGMEPIPHSLAACERKVDLCGKKCAKGVGAASVSLLRVLSEFPNDVQRYVDSAGVRKCI